MRRLALPLVALTLLTCATTRSLPRGVVYLSEDGSREIRAHSASELDYRDGETRYRGRYSLDGDRLRVVLRVDGTETVHYFTLDAQGLVGEDETTLLAVDPGSAFEVVDHRRAQRETMAAMRTVGTALVAWFTDQVGTGAAGASVVVGDYPPVGAGDVETLLVPDYLKFLPPDDGWGHPFEYRLAVDDPLAPRAILIRSPGADGRFDGDAYEIGAYDPRLFDRDLVWGDGYFMSWPERKP
jgi:hypothetical protein